ncbi:acyl carrier protein [Streptomyces sp. NPDC014892]|uniref:acyl carrier protein n=1 Tax=Streptomyces sp. NPDC014892 TaxID=3364930 RepID=UPI003702AF91
MTAETAGPPVTEAAPRGAAAPTVLTTGLVRELLSDRKIFPGVPDNLDEDAELVLDSLGLVWLLHVVEERYGLIVEPRDEDIANLTSLRRLTEFLGAAGAPDSAGAGAASASDAAGGGERGDR